MRRLVYVLPLAVFTVLVVYFALGLGMDPKIIPSALIDKPAPHFTLPPIEGGVRRGFSDIDLKGGVSVINVFASWCIPCKAEHPPHHAPRRDGGRHRLWPQLQGQGGGRA